jgi:hypothetical protein
VIVNGIVRAGIQNKMNITITEDPATHFPIVTIDPDPGISYSWSIENYELGILDQIYQLTLLKVEYSGNSAATSAFDAEIRRLERQLESMGLCRQEWIDPNDHSKGTVTVCDSEFPIIVVTINDVWGAVV